MAPRRMRISAGVFITLALSFGPTEGFGQGWRLIHPIEGMSFRSELEITYDDNAFSYSAEDIDKFVNNQEPHRFPIETYDDLITTLSLSAKLRKHPIANRLTTLNIHHKQHNYTLNPEKSYQVLSFNLWQSLPGRNHLQLGYLFLPSYLIRHYPDWDMPPESGHPAYVGCRFGEHLFSLTLGGEIPGGFTLSAFYRREIDDYNDNFNEYDTEANRLGMEGGYDFGETLSLVLGYRFKQARAKGYDTEGETKETSDDSDISYDRDTFIIETGIDMERWRGVPLSLNLNYSFERTCFTSQKSLWDDPYHVGREDRGHQFGVEVGYQPNSRLRLYLGYSGQVRDVDSPYPGEIDEVKDFKQNRLSGGIRLSY